VAPGRIRIIFSAAFALALIAGAAAAVLAMRFISRPAPAPTATASTLDDLGLSPAQREQIKQIWEKVLSQSDDLYTRTKALQADHDNRIFKLLTPEQKKQYDEIYNQDRETYARLRAQHDARLKKAINDTRMLLSDSQRGKYDGILKNRLGRSAEPDAGWLSAPAATQPANPANLQQDFQSQVRR
jgi:Spy/CpxP family protein refolding chaperone